MWRDVGHTYVQYYFYVQITFVGKNIKFVATKNTLTYSNIIMSCNLKNDATYIFDDTKKIQTYFQNKPLQYILQICLLFQKLRIIYNLNTITVDFDSPKNIVNTRIHKRFGFYISFTPKQIPKNM